MATYPTGWLRLPTDAKDFKERFAWSHVKAIFYDKAKNILLKDKLDAMDKLISDHADAIANKLMTNDAFNTAIADYVTKSMMSGVQVNDGDHVPTSALAYAMQQAITANANAITRLNSDKLDRKTKGTYTNEDINGAFGYITTGKKEILIFIPMVFAPSVTKITVSSCILEMRISTGGYAAPYKTDVANLLSNAQLLKSRNLLYLKFTNTNDCAETNNIPICGFIKMTYTLS